MCGVVGFIDVGGRDARPKEERVTRIRRGIRTIVHRGPDEAGLFDSRDFTLGTVRLSIVDVPLGKQPMMTGDSRYVVGFNGEVFNYLELREELKSKGVRFVTNSDTEVLLNSLAYWGRDALNKLNGQFGFAFYDRLERELILGRDPFGERPLFYTVQDGTLLFASEIKGLFAFPEVRRELAPAQLRRALRFWGPVPGETCFEGIHAIPPGHILTVRDGRMELSRYYHGLTRRRETSATSLKEAAADVRTAIRESVRLRLRGDFPLGAYISGGLDSSVIALTIAELTGEPLRTFSLRVPESPVDESPFQKILVSALGSEHSTVDVTSRDVRRRFPKVMEQCEQPIPLTPATAYGILAEHVGNSGVRIMLGGEGADEAFAGYDAVKEAVVLDRCLRNGDFGSEAAAELDAVLDDQRHTDPTTATEILRFFAERAGDESIALGGHLRRFEGAPVDRLVPAPGGLAEDNGVLLRRLREDFPDFDERPYDERSLIIDQQIFLIGYGMTCLGDRPGTGCGVEGRYPFMDRNVVETAFGLPLEWKLKDLRREKLVLREAFADVLPPEILDRPKFGLRIPSAAALRRDVEDDWVGDVLSPEAVRRAGVLDPDAVNELVERVHSVPGAQLTFPYSQMYVQVLGILLMDEQLVRNFAVPDVDIDRIMVNQFDGDRDLPTR